MNIEKLEKFAHEYNLDQCDKRTYYRLHVTTKDIDGIPYITMNVKRRFIGLGCDKLILRIERDVPLGADPDVVAFAMIEIFNSIDFSFLDKIL